MDLQDVERLTIEAGEGWAYPHARRLLFLIERIAPQGQPYDCEALAYAALLHDWGALERYRLPGAVHALRSAEIAGTEILPHTDLSPERQALIVQAIARHDYRCPDPPGSLEALLLREADFLEFLGATGIAREFAWGPKALGRPYARILERMSAIRGRFTLPKAQHIAGERLRRMEIYLDQLREECGDLLS